MARVSNLWKKTGDALESVFPAGASILIKGLDRYLNFGFTHGSTGYGIRDNNGTLQFKNSLGEWTNFGSGGGEGVPAGGAAGQFLAKVSENDFDTEWVDMTDGYAYFSIWAEESSSISSATYEWAYGNGDDTPNGSGIVLGVNAELFAIGLEVESGESSVSVEKNGSVVGTSDNFSGSGLTTLGSPVSFSAGDVMNFVTGTTVSGGASARAVAWFRVPVKGQKGDKGDPGIPGADGDVTWQGQWSAGTYTQNQVVENGGSSYVVTAVSTTEEPGVGAADWDLVAEKGNPGDSGATVPMVILTKSTSANQNVGGANGAETYWTWDAETIKDSDFSFTATSSEVTVTAAGWYEITFIGAAQTTGSSRTTLQGIHRINGGTTSRAGSLRNYTRGSVYGNITTGLIYTLQLSANDIIEVGTRVEDSDATYVINTSGGEIADDCHQLVIKKIR